MTKSCFLHIGTTKTGTSAIQATLDVNRDLFNRYDYHIISNSVREGNSDYKLVLAHKMEWKYPIKDISLNLLGIYDKEDKLKFNEATISSYEAEILNSHSSNLIISCEQYSYRIMQEPHLLSRTLKFLAGLGYQTKIVVYLRSQVDWILSDYMQNTKDGGIKSLNKFVYDLLSEEAYLYNLHHLVGLIRRFTDNYILRPYTSKSLNSGDSIFDFLENVLMLTADQCSSIVIPDSKYSNSLKPSKEGISDILEFNRTYRKENPGHYELNRKLVLGLILKSINTEPLVLSEETKAHVMQTYSAGNKELSSIYSQLSNLSA